MTHQQLFDKLAARHLVQSIDEDVVRLTSYAMSYHKDSTGSQLAYILPKLLLRWNCVFNADKKEVSDGYKHKTALALAITLHKYGFADKTITDQALEAIDSLNKEVILSDDFFRKSDEIKKFLSATPVALKRKPSIPESITFYRAKDVVSIQLYGKFYAAYIHRLSAPNESPVLEFYEGEFNEVPTLKELEKRNARGVVYKDGIERVSLFAIYGMKSMPDPANQIQLISACVEEKPFNQHLDKTVGLFSVSDLFRMQNDMKQIFGLDNR